LGVTHLRSNLKSRYAWFKFLNKPLALLTAEDHAQTDTVCWLDSDLLFLSNPDELWLKPGEDFVGFPVEDKEMGTTGAHDDPYEKIWQDFCRLLDLDINELPWVTTAETGERVRFYLNGGIFAYRKASGFARMYNDICLALLDSNIGTPASNYNVGLKEMSAIGFAVVKLGLKWRALSYSHDYVVSSYTHAQWYREEMLKQAVIVHYHDAMWPHFWPTFLKCMQSTHPIVATWLEQVGPMQNKAALHWKIVSKILNKQRTAAENSYRKSGS
jgi:hypothetical protein